MKTAKNKLNQIKKILQENDNLTLETYNKKLTFIGCASFFANGEEKIRVYEGNPDGSDDKELTYDEFIENYDFEIKEEL